MKIRYELIGKEITLSVARAFMDDGYRVWVYTSTGESRTWVSSNGNTDRVFDTEDEAEEAILSYTMKYYRLGIIKGFTVS